MEPKQHAKIMKFKQQAELGSCPCDIDHIMAANQFESHDGVNQVKKCAGLKTISIHTLIDQVLREAEEMMKGSVHEKDFFVYLGG